MSSRLLSVTAATIFSIALCASVALAANGFGNGGFEDATPVSPPPVGGTTSFAACWLSAPTGFPVTLSTNARTGQYAALLSVPTGFGGSTMFQNSIAEGGRPDLIPGDAPVLTFWAKGDVGVTGNILFALRYLDANGIIVWNSGNVFFQNSVNAATWTQITYAAPVVPANAKAAFIEMNTAVGPILDNRPNAVLVDDLMLSVATPVPAQGTTWGRLKNLWR